MLSFGGLSVFGLTGPVTEYPTDRQQSSAAGSTAVCFLPRRSEHESAIPMTEATGSRHPPSALRVRTRACSGVPGHARLLRRPCWVRRRKSDLARVRSRVWNHTPCTISSCRVISALPLSALPVHPRLAATLRRTGAPITCIHSFVRLFASLTIWLTERRIQPGQLGMWLGEYGPAFFRGMVCGGRNGNGGGRRYCSADKEST